MEKTDGVSPEWLKGRKWERIGGKEDNQGSWLLYQCVDNPRIKWEALFPKGETRAKHWLRFDGNAWRYDAMSDYGIEQFCRAYNRQYCSLFLRSRRGRR